MDAGPYFVAGIERSGTSLMYALLASHPNIAMTRRTNLWTHFYGQYGHLRRPENFERCLAAMLRYKRLVPLKLDPPRIRREFWDGEPSYARLFALIEEHYAERQGKRHWGDKSLNTERYVDPIFAAYPTAKVIHMIRDPRDRYASALTRWKAIRGGVGAGTAMWLSSVRLARRNQKRHPDRYLIVRYESLVCQPEATLREICAFIGEAYSPAILAMEGAQQFRDEGGNSSYGRHEAGSIATSSIGRFRRLLPAGQIAFTQAVARQDMLAFGYRPEPFGFSPREWLTFAVIDVPLNMTRMLAWMGREAYLNRVGRALPSYRIVGNGQRQRASA